MAPELDDYVSIVCGSLDRLAEAFAELDREERERRLQGKLAGDQEEIGPVPQIAGASLSTADRRVVRTEAMNCRIYAAANSRAPRRRSICRL